jgi:hypothetical protein
VSPRAAPRSIAAARSGVAAAAALLALAATLACGGQARTDPVFERIRVVTDDAEAVRAIAATLSAYGGLDTWATRRNVAYRFALAVYAGDPAPRRTTLQIHRLTLGPEVHLEMEDLDPAPLRTVRIDGDRVTVGGAAPEGDDDTEFRLAYGLALRRDIRLPWSLLDEGTSIDSRGVRTPAPAGPVPPGPCDVLRLRMSDDWQDLYISRRSHLIEQVHSYRAGPNDFRLSVWADHRAFDGIRVATRRSTYSSDAAATVGRLEAVAEYSDVRFDVEWTGAPGEEPPPAGPPAGETPAADAPAAHAAGPAPHRAP